MKLTLWTYEGPPHIGAMRIATAMEDVHYVLHAPQGDTYADLLFTMIERMNKRPPVTYTYRRIKRRKIGVPLKPFIKWCAYLEKSMYCHRERKEPIAPLVSRLAAIY